MTPSVREQATGRLTTLRTALAGRFDRLRQAELPSNDEGFTIAEVVVSIALFVIISVAVMYALLTLVKDTGVTQNRVAAANLARQEVEQLRGQNNTLSMLDSGPSTVRLQGTTFTITPLLSPAANASCAPGAARNATVTVSWPGSGSRTVRYDTVLSC